MSDHNDTDPDHHGIRVGYTLTLTKAFENGEISADDYVSKRAELIGRPNLIHGLLLPIYQAFRHSFQQQRIDRADT